MKSSYGGRIWIMGGAELNREAMNEGLIDRVLLADHPILLEKGVPLFGADGGKIPEDFVCVRETEYDTGLIQTEWKLRTAMTDYDDSVAARIKGGPGVYQ